MPVSPAAVLRAAPGLGGAGQLTHGGEDAAAQAEGDGDGGLAHAARARVDEHRLPALYAPSHHQRVVGGGVDDGDRGRLLQGPVVTAHGSLRPEPGHLCAGPRLPGHPTHQLEGTSHMKS